MTKERSYTGGRIRLQVSQDSAEEMGRKLARWSLNPENADPDECYDLLRRHMANALDGFAPKNYDTYVHGFFNEMAVELHRIHEVDQIGARVAREVWRENEIRQTDPA